MILMTVAAGILLASCGPTITSTVKTTSATLEPTTTKPLPSATAVQLTSTLPLVVATSSPPTEELAGTEPTQEPVAFVLGEPGPYHAGNREITYSDDQRDGRQVRVLVWYPAREQTDDEGKLIVRDAEPDLGAAPYPLILTEENSGRYLFLSHLASHGFVMAAIQDQPATSDRPWDDPWEESLVMGPVIDFLFALDRLAQAPPAGLENVIDADHTGVVGFSYGGDISLTLSGARVDPAFYRTRCEQTTTIEGVIKRWVYVDVICRDAANWDQFLASMDETTTVSDDGLWRPITDERIRAVMPMAPSVSWYFGERGLAAADRPVLILFGTRDADAPYVMEAGYTLEHLGAPDRTLISFVGKTHYMVFVEEPASKMKHFTVAFFGTYLQGKEEYREYFSEEFVAQFNDLVWGEFVDD
jgi:predicted dienelactone hydrolase